MKPKKTVWILGTKSRSDFLAGPKLIFRSLIFFFRFPLAQSKKKILIQFFEVRSASGFYQVILFLAFYSSINYLIEFGENNFL